MANAALDVLEAETPKPTPIIGKIKNACRLLQAKVTDKIVKTLVQQLVDKAVAIFKFSLF